MSVPYDFQNLSFDDFERLCADLLQVKLGISLESFKVGRDRGIDLRHAPSGDGTLIVQCKRYRPGAFARLLRNIKNEELVKVQKLAPARYVLCTSCQLSPDQKDSLFETLSPYCASPDDIVGADELNRLIAADADIERRHFKLWLGSTAILQRVLHAGVFAYSEHEVESLRREISRYVVHDGFYRALSLLDQSHHCIIVGIPGVGKTIAARLLLAHYLREGFDVISVTRDIEEAWAVIDRPGDAKVVVYYDDFLGQMTFSQKLGKNEDRRLLELVSHCKNSKNKRFILTTRDYIFDQALTAYEPLGRAKDELQRSSVRLDDYGLVVRARLLANHLQFSSVGLETLRELVKTRGYDRIIHHQNFLPRVIEQICGAKGVETMTPSRFIRNAFELLDDPAEVWKRPFQQLSRDAQFLAYSLASLDGEHESGRLEAAWRSLCQRMGHSVDRLYLEVMREIEGSFTHSQMHQSLATASSAHGTMVRFINPSAREYVLADLISKPDLLAAVFASAVAFEQLLFWSEARTSFTGRSPPELASQFSDEIARRSLQLLSTTEPEVVTWANQMRMKWRPAAKRMTRLHALFNALAGMQRHDLVRANVLALFGENLGVFSDYLQQDDLMWASEVLQVVLNVCGSSGTPGLARACEILQVERWVDLPQDFIDVRYVWQAAGWAIEASTASFEWDDRMRAALVRRTKELCATIPQGWSADEISNAADELELVVGELGDSLKVDLLLLRERADEARPPQDEDDRGEVRLAGRYRSRSRTDVEADVDGIFENLVEQLGAIADS